jgi:hypothetical protein
MSTNGHGLTDTEARIKAREMIQAADAAGQPITGADVGKAFRKTDRWGRKQIERARSAGQAMSVPTGTAGPAPRPGARNAQRAPGGTTDDRDRLGEARTGTASTTGRREGGTLSRDGRAVGRDHAGTGRATTPASREARHAPGPTSAAADADVVALTSGVRRISTLAVVAVALVAAVASYDHQRVLAEMAGEGWRAWMLPISVDGLVVAASMSMLVRRRAGLPTGALTWLALLAGIGASLAANVAAAEPTLVGRFVAAWPPLAFAVAFEMAMRTRAVHDGRTTR